MCRYNPKIDLVFRKLFGSQENKDILLSFINAVLNREPKIKDLEIKNPYNLADYLQGKMSILDIKAVDEAGKWYDIEMQLAEQGAYGKRSLYYWGKVYTDQIKKAEDYRELRKTIGIHLLDFDYFTDDRYHRQVVLKDAVTNQSYPELDYQELHFIEMSKFKKDVADLKTVLDRWINFLNKAYEYDKGNLPEELRQEEGIQKAIERLEKMYFDEQEQEIYQAERKRIMDKKEEIRTAEERGLEKGREQEQVNSAIKLLKKGYSQKEIIDLLEIDKRIVQKANKMI
ncbi:Rpn family recombination-promoting nuclease/putative transposase [Halanaerocella petrolearia]